MAPVERAQPAYDAFISYSRAVDGQLAPRLESALERFAKPWYRLRALDVFRDDTDLSANPGLWRSLCAVLERVDFFVLLASPGAAESTWVGREVGYWIEHRGGERLLIALTEGGIAWDEEHRDFDWQRTDALPRALAGAFAEEPRYTDLRFARRDEHLSLTDPRFREAVADIAATLHGRPKGELIGEDVRQHRRTMRLARGAVALLSVLGLAAAIASLVAVDRARREQEQARLALAREVAATAVSQLPVDRQRGLLLGLESVQIEETPQGAAALRQALFKTNAIRTLARPRGVPTSTVFSPDGRFVAVASLDGTTRLSESRSGRLISVFGLDSAPLAAAFSPDGEQIVTGSEDGRGTIWEVATGRPRAFLRGELGAVSSVAFSPDSRSVITAGDDGLRVWDATSGELIREFPGTLPELPRSVEFSADAQRLVAVTTQQVEIWDVQGGRRIGSIDPQGTIAGASLDATGEHVLVVTKDEAVRLWDVAASSSQTVLPGHRQARVMSAELSPDGELAVATEPRTVRVWQLSTGQPLAAIRHAGAARYVPAQLDPSGQWLAVTTADDRVRLYSCAVCAASLDELVTEARSQLTRELTRDERMKYLHEGG